MGPSPGLVKGRRQTGGPLREEVAPGVGTRPMGMGLIPTSPVATVEGLTLTREPHAAAEVAVAAPRRSGKVRSDIAPVLGSPSPAAGTGQTEPAKRFRTPAPLVGRGAVDVMRTGPGLGCDEVVVLGEALGP